MVAHTVKTTRAAEAQRVPVRQLVDRRAAAFAALREPLALLVDACRTLAGELAPFLPGAAATRCLPDPAPLFPRILAPAVAPATDTEADREWEYPDR